MSTPNPRPSPRRRVRRRGAGAFVFVLLLAGGAGATAYRVQLAVRDQLPTYVRGHLERTLGRPVRFGAIRAWPPGSFTIARLEVPPVPGEAVAPLRARRARAFISWPELWSRRRVRVTRVDLYAPQVNAALDLQRIAGQPTLNERILGLAGSGLESVRVANASLRLVTTLPDARTETITVRGLTGRLGVSPQTFAFQGSAREWSSGAGAVRATRIRLHGEGDAGVVRLAGGELAYRGGHLRARGSYRDLGQQLSLRLDVKNLPLRTAAQEMGIAADWKLAGRVSGQLEMAADGGGLRRVTGLLSAEEAELGAAGLAGDFRWRSASGRIDWDRSRIEVRDLRVRGDGVELAGWATVTGRPEELATQGRYVAGGRARLTGRQAVARLAAVLTHAGTTGNPALPDVNWSAANAELDFEAGVALGRSAGLQASGRIAMTGVRLQPGGAGPPLEIRRLTSRFRRDTGVLRLDGLELESPGVRADGRMSVTDATPSSPARFAANGTVRLTDPHALRRLMPRAPAGRWLQTSSPGTGEVRLAAAGLLRSPGDAQVDGDFHLRQARVGLPTASGQGANEALVSLRSARGRFAHTSDRLRLTELAVEALPDGGPIAVSGSATLTGLSSPDPSVQLDLEASGSGWERLPGVTARMTRRLRGGRFRLGMHAASRVSRLASATFSGDLELADTSLLWPEGVEGVSDRERAVRRLTAHYVREGDTLRLTGARLDGDAIQATATVFVHCLGAEDPRVELQAEARIGRWERLPGVPNRLGEFLQGGELVAGVHAADRLSQLDTGPSSGDFRLEGATLNWHDGEGRAVRLPVESLRGRFDRGTTAARLTGLRLRAPGLDLTGEVKLQPLTAADPDISATGRVRIAEWQRLPGLPRDLLQLVRGGELSGNLTLTGAASRLELAAATGDFQLTNCEVRLPQQEPAASPASQPTPADQRQPVPLASLAGRFRRSGDELRLDGLLARGGGLEATGWLELDGLLEPDPLLRADLRLVAERWRELPGVSEEAASALEGGRLTVNLQGGGRLGTLAAADWNGDLRLEGATLTSGEQGPQAGTPPLLVTLAAARFRRGEHGWLLPHVEARTPVGQLLAKGALTVPADGTPSRFVLEGEVVSGDASALLNRIAPLPALCGGTLAATLRIEASTDALAAAQVTGSLKARGARYQPESASGEAAEALLVSHFDADFARDRQTIALRNVSASLPLYRMSGSGVIANLGGIGGPTLDARLKFTSEQWQKMLGLDAGLRAVEGGRLTLENHLIGPWTALSLEGGQGGFLLEHASLHVPGSEGVVPVTRLTGHFRTGETGVELLGMQLASPLGTAEGSGSLRGSGDAARHEFDLRWRTDRPGALLAPFVALPGELDGGRLGGRVRFHGGGGEPIAGAEGDFALTEARFAPAGGVRGGNEGVTCAQRRSPAKRVDEGGLPRLSIDSFRGTFRKEGLRTTFRALRLESPGFRAGGELGIKAKTESERLDLAGTIDLENLGSFLDQFPAVKGMVEGGRLHARLEAQADPRAWGQATGSGTLEATGGRFHFPDMKEKFNRASFHPLRAELAWDAEGIDFRALSLRGDRYNLDAAGKVRYAGHMDMDGHVWLTRSFGRSMMPKGFTGFVGRLFGMMPKQIESSFRIHGDVDRPTLSMGITHRRLWKYARRKVTKPNQRIATGKEPVWDLTGPSARPRPTFRGYPAAARTRSASARRTRE